MEIIRQYNPFNIKKNYRKSAEIALDFAKRFMNNESSYDLDDITSHNTWIGGIFEGENVDMLCEKREGCDIWDFNMFPTEEEIPKVFIATIERK